MRQGERTIQVSELLYLLCGAIDGERDVTEIAAVVSAASRRQAAASDISYLLEHKLAPLGLLAGGAPVPPPRRMLALSARVGVLPGGAVRRVTGPLGVLFRPAVVAAVLIALVAVDGWLLRTHDLGRSVGDVVANPSLVLVLAALTLAAGAFHELGHATACRYGGAEPGTIGVGIYLVWPVFYNNLDDSYRLDRAGRLRADLGGVYFNAVFIVLLGAACAATGYAPLVVAVSLQHVAILRQFLPFVRLDGYYIVSDLAGVPDLFARIRSVMSSLVPGRAAGPEVTGLTPRARVIVTAWVVVSVPVLGALLALFLVRLPAMATTAWIACGQRARAGAAAWHAGATSAAVGHWLQGALVVVPPVGLLLTAGHAVRMRFSSPADHDRPS